MQGYVQARATPDVIWFKIETNEGMTIIIAWRNEHFFSNQLLHKQEGHNISTMAKKRNNWLKLNFNLMKLVLELLEFSYKI